jgi:serine/threonine-protein kinase
VGRAVRWTCQLLDALDHAHARKFVHRDVKPANLLVSGAVNAEEVRLCDFGLARIYQASQLSGLTMTGDVGGTPVFMAPEQVISFRESPPSVDQYGAAATLYYLLTGQFLFANARTNYEVVAQLLEGKVVPIRERRPDLPVALARIVERALAREPARRFADVGEMRTVLERFSAF